VIHDTCVNVGVGHVSFTVINYDAPD